jgi:hypothetical protein
LACSYGKNNSKNSLNYVTAVGNTDLVENSLTSSLDIVQVKKLLIKAADILAEGLCHCRVIFVGA